MHGAGHLILEPNKGAVLPVILQYPDFHATNPGEGVTGVTYDLVLVRYAILSGHATGNANSWLTKTLRASVIAQVVDSGSRTTLVDAARVEANDWWNGALLTLSVGANTFHRVVNDFVAGTDTLHFDPLSFELAVADVYDLLFWDELGHGNYLMSFGRDEINTGGSVGGLLVYHVQLIADETVLYNGSAQIHESLAITQKRS